MISVSQYDSIVLSLFSGQFTIDELEAFANKLHTICEDRETVYLMSIPVGVTEFPKSISEIVKAFKIIRSSTKPVTRIYGIKYNPILSFVSSVAAQIFKLKNSTVETASVEDMFAVIERDGEAFPELKRSWEKHKGAIKAEINEREQGITAPS